MLDLLVGILHLVVFPGGLFALALGLFLKGCDRTNPAASALNTVARTAAASKPGSSAGWGRR